MSLCVGAPGRVARLGGGFPMGWRFPGGAASSARRFCGSYVAVARWRGAYPTVRRRSGGDSLAVVWGLPDGVALNLVWRRLNRHPSGAIASELGNRLVRGSYKRAERGWPRHPDPDRATAWDRRRAPSTVLWAVRLDPVCKNEGYDQVRYRCLAASGGCRRIDRRHQIAPLRRVALPPAAQLAIEPAR